MLKKFFMAAIVGMIICASVKAEAEDVYVGKSDATGWVCYIMTETINFYREGDMFISSATLKMRDERGVPHYLDYNFSDFRGVGVDVHFENSQGYSGEVHPSDTPIEWGMYEVIRKYY
ncbi:MAG: hypothetical protein IKT98_09545 [Selenomonadaceae bacterium]|nr:hypothetical protein [Selenomonadaceae bacterium]